MEGPTFTSCYEEVLLACHGNISGTFPTIHGSSTCYGGQSWLLSNDGEFHAGFHLSPEVPSHREARYYLKRSVSHNEVLVFVGGAMLLFVSEVVDDGYSLVLLVLDLLITPWPNLGI